MPIFVVYIVFLIGSILKFDNDSAFLSLVSRLLKSREAWYVGRCFPLLVLAFGRCKLLRLLVS